VVWEGYPGAPEAPKKVGKKKAWEQIQPLLNTDSNGIACYKQSPFTLPGGQCRATICAGIIS